MKYLDGIHAPEMAVHELDNGILFTWIQDGQGFMEFYLLPPVTENFRNNKNTSN